MNIQITTFLLVLIASLFHKGCYSQDFQKKRYIMIEQQLKKRGISSPTVLEAMENVPRHLFVPEKYRSMAYDDRPLPIGHGQTISQPYIVALMTETLNLGPGSRILEIGTGSGYQAAVLADMGMEVYSIEIVPELAVQAIENLKVSGYTNVNVHIGDGYKGWPEKGPFDGILLTAAPEEIPQALLNQLKPGGIMILPVGAVNQVQTLKKIIKHKDGNTETNLLDVRFVPMIRNEK